ANEGLDQALHLLGDPADLLPADRVERPGEALVQREQVRDVAHAALAEPAHQLAVVAHQLLGLATDVDRHCPPASFSERVLTPGGSEVYIRPHPSRNTKPSRPRR